MILPECFKVFDPLGRVSGHFIELTVDPGQPLVKLGCHYMERFNFLWVYIIYGNNYIRFEKLGYGKCVFQIKIHRTFP